MCHMMPHVLNCKPPLLGPGSTAGSGRGSACCLELSAGFESFISGFVPLECCDEFKLDSVPTECLGFVFIGSFVDGSSELIPVDGLVSTPFASFVKGGLEPVLLGESFVEEA